MLLPSQIENVEWNLVNKIQFADATKKLPFKNNSIECIYTCHMFEHLSQTGATKFLNETHRILEKEGILRINIPDIRILVDRYLEHGDADLFMTELKVQPLPTRTLRQKIVFFFTGYRHHQWMYDGRSLCKLLEIHGFQSVQICKSGFTQIQNPADLDLHEREDISVIVEGKKSNDAEISAG